MELGDKSADFFQAAGFFCLLLAGGVELLLGGGGLGFEPGEGGFMAFSVLAKALEGGVEGFLACFGFSEGVLCVGELLLGVLEGVNLGLERGVALLEGGELLGGAVGEVALLGGEALGFAGGGLEGGEFAASGVEEALAGGEVFFDALELGAVFFELGGEFR